jgi:hypothetical protein
VVSHAGIIAGQHIPGLDGQSAPKQGQSAPWISLAQQRGTAIKPIDRKVSR